MMLKRLARAVWRRLPQPLRKLFDRIASPLVKHRLNRVRVEADIAQWLQSHRRPVSIVIPSYNDVALLKKCIRSIRKHTAEFTYEIIVVDDFCEPANTAKLKKLQARDVKVVFKATRGGFAVSVNEGMRHALHDIVLLNSDTEALHGWLDALQYAAYAIDSSIGLVSAKLLYPNGRIQYGGTFHAARMAPQWFAHLYAGSFYNKPAANVGAYNYGISGACMFVRREVYQFLGGLNEAYWLGFEDVDYAMKAWTSGFKCYYEPRATLIHHESATRGYSQGAREFASMRYFWQAWSEYFTGRNDRLDHGLVEIFVSPENKGSIWHEYVSELLSTNSMVSVASREISSPEEIDPRSSSNAIRVAVDAESLQAAWLASVLRGLPVHFLEAERLSKMLAEPKTLSQLKPEFAYISPNAVASSTLQNNTAWASAETIAPAFRPEPIPKLEVEDFSNRRVCIVTSNENKLPLVSDAEIHVFDYETLSMDDLAEIRRLKPRVVVSTVNHASSLLPHYFMSVGAAFVGLQNDNNALTVMDGQNALLASSDSEQLSRLVDDALTLDSVWSELRNTGYETALKVHHQAAQRWQSFLDNPRIS